MKKLNLFKKVLVFVLFAFAMFAFVGGVQKVKAVSTPGTINFNTNETRISSASVTGEDDLGNEWTVTTTGTSSFTTNAAYYQVGSSKSPATTITFTTTLSSSVNITSMSAKFGGFSGTAGAITLKVGDTTIGTGNLNEANDVTVTSNKSSTGTVLTVTITGIAKGVKCYFIKYTYDDGNTTPTANITSSNYFCQLDLDGSVKFTAESYNVPNATAMWSSSDTSVATINTSTGDVTPLSVGTTNITVKYVDSTDPTNESKWATATKEFKVYPSALGTISIAQALEVCALAGTDISPYKYECRGVVSDVTANIFVLTDSTGSIKVKSTTAHSKEEGAKVSVNGYLKIESSNNEFYGSAGAALLYTDFYDVTFDSNGGSSVSPITWVEKGSTIAQPSTPNYPGHTFEGWYNGDVKWNFENDVVTSNIVLVANWESQTLNNFQSTLNSFAAYMSLSYSFNYEDSVPTDVLNRTKTGVENGSDTYSDWNVTDSTTAVYEGYSAGGNDSIQLRSKNSNSGIVSTTSGGKVTKVNVVWYSDGNNGRALEVYGKNTAYTSPTDLYDNTKKGELLGTIVYGASTSLTINGDYEYIGVRSSSGAMYLTSISFEWGNKFSNDSFKFRCGIDKGLATAISNNNEMASTAVYGIEVSTNSKTLKYQSNNALFTSDENYEYVVIDLGTVMQNLSRIDVEFTVRAYVTYDGGTIYSTASKTYSVYSIVKKYYEDDVEEVLDFCAILEELGYEF